MYQAIEALDKPPFTITHNGDKVTKESATALLGYSVIEFLLGVDAPVSLELLRQIVIGVLADAVIALPLWALVRRCLVGGLPEDPRRRRRRAYTTGGLSPLSRGSSGSR